jgi:predicted porin
VEIETLLLDLGGTTLKKQLLCTSAIALGVAAAPAAAQDWNLDWGGFFNTHVAFGDISTNATISALTAGVSWEGDGLDIHTNPEIIFSPSVTLDNGMTFGINIQLEGNTTGGPFIDESYASMSSDTFGRLDVGNENSAGYKLMTAAPEVTSMSINSPSTSTFIPYTGVDAALAVLAGAGSVMTALPFRQAGLSAYTEVGGNNDVNRITYYTPDFNGLTVGLSYAPTALVNAGSTFSVNTNAVLSDVFDIGVNYSNTFGSTDVTLSARWGTGDTPSVAAGASDFETWGVGFQVGFGNFTVGGSYAENDNDETLAPAGALTPGDSEGWSLGVTYDTAGPWSFEALTYQSETDLNAAGAATPFKTDREAYRIGASRTLGPGVDWDIYVVHESRDVKGPAAVLSGAEVEGTILGTAINLSF